MLEKQPSSNLELLTGAEILVQSLIQHQVDLLFGYPGGAILPVFDSFYTTAFHNVLIRHEQAAAHAAEGYAKTSGKTGVACVTSGPGAANTLTGIADAMLDSVPLVVFTGQVATSAIGTHAFQELDIVKMATPITKACFQVTSVESLPTILDRAFELAQAGRKGPVLVDLPKDVMGQKCYIQKDRLAHQQPRLVPQPTLSLEQTQQVQFILASLKAARKPVVLVGAGVTAAKASALLRTFVTRWHVPVVSTLLGLGNVPVTSDLSLGMAGMHGQFAANMALHECDFLLNIGARFDDRLVPNVAKFAPNAKIAHVDIDANEIGRIVPVDLPFVGDAHLALQALLQADLAPEFQQWQSWLQLCQQRHLDHPYHYHKAEAKLKPQEVIGAVGTVTKGQAIVVTDVGQHQMWAAQFYPYQMANQLVTSGGLGTMGFGIPAAIGAAYAHPDKTIVLFVGDGGFQMTSEELEVLAIEQLNIKIVLLNNQTLGMVRQWQDEFYQQHHSASMFPQQPNFEALAAAYGISYQTLQKQDDLVAKLDLIFAKPGPFLIHVPIPTFEQVYPMIAPGHGNNEMMGVDD
ncbi:biosynthetic-type acetolactate synthase large subunit [Lactobacillus sp. CC-MHH1034]|uniref:biosynthetic-type acetolactate synthase large subunit n=1 Tax=Agrilactobacillus fermenti TaxID=2586909 RepID=UPI001E3A1410|nr:biosynthetic-type acetolactate synthase large subunit [Agrilactobacillus fermenti]MCD2256007.1 biosynthetic-type acetolactate synthase large subunit [Agrilactobacillus fermenti]